MPVPPTFGVFAGHGGGVTPATFINAVFGEAPAASFALPFTGASAGNIAVVTWSFSNMSTPAGWNVISDFFTAQGYQQQVYYKVLSSGDISAGSVTFNGVNIRGIYQGLFYSGATVATVKSTVESGGSTLTIPGFTKDVASKGVLSYVVDRDPVASFVPPGTWTPRISPFAETFFAAGTADILPVSYSNGSNVVWTGFSTSFQQVGQIIELT